MGCRSMMGLAVALAAVLTTGSAVAEERAQPSALTQLEKTVKDLLAVTVVSPRTEVVAESKHGPVTRLTGSLKLAPTLSGRTWGMTAIVVF